MYVLLFLLEVEHGDGKICRSALKWLRRNSIEHQLRALLLTFKEVTKIFTLRSKQEKRSSDLLAAA